MNTKFIFVTGGVFSGLGKGIVTSTIGLLLKQQGYSVTAIKIDPYINFDAGTMRPTEHGEVWVTDDGGEIDQDLGNYERFLDVNISREHNITTGKVFDAVIQRERRGEYLGQTVQPIPHVTDDIKNRIRKIARESLVDFVIIEIGGIVGDYENILFLEAARQLYLEEKVVFIHVGFLPIPNHIGEMKTKPMQRSVKELNSIGIQPNFIVCRASAKLDSVRKRKISLFCNVHEQNIISAPDVKVIYEVPIVFEEQRFGEKILKAFGLEYIADHESFKNWRKFVEKLKSLTKDVKIGIIGKYFDIGEFCLGDSYISVLEAVRHAAWANNVKPEIIWIDSKIFETDPKSIKKLKDFDGIIIPGGFGKGGAEGKISAIKFCRENKKPFLGLCYGLQLAVVEYARSICKLENANSTEIDEKTPHPVIDILPEQKKILEDQKYGATMRLGAYPAILKSDTKVWKLYNEKSSISERHRHRFEVNPEYIKKFEEKGLVFSGISPDRRLVEFLELKDHPYFIATQSHPEFKSKPLRPAPLFDGFIKAICTQKKFKQEKL